MASSATSRMLNPASSSPAGRSMLTPAAAACSSAGRGDGAGSLSGDQLLPGAGAAEVVAGGARGQADDVELTHLAPGRRLAGPRAKDRHAVSFLSAWPCPGVPDLQGVRQWGDLGPATRRRVQAGESGRLPPAGGQELGGRRQGRRAPSGRSRRRRGRCPGGVHPGLPAPRRAEETRTDSRPGSTPSPATPLGRCCARGASSNNACPSTS